MKLRRGQKVWVELSLAGHEEKLHKATIDSHNIRSKLAHVFIETDGGCIHMVGFHRIFTTEAQALRRSLELAAELPAWEMKNVW